MSADGGVAFDAVTATPLVEEPTERPPARSSRTRSAVEWGVVIVGAVLVALVIKTFVMQAFFIPSSSMEPTLLINDRVLVNKLSYRFGDPERGDIVVFERPDGAVTTDDDINDLIKRVVGLPGDSIVIEDGAVAVNGTVLTEDYLPESSRTENGLVPCTTASPCVVPEGEIFVMGDNRRNSHDSRYIGTIPESSIVGEAFVRIWPLNRAGGL